MFSRSLIPSYALPAAELVASSVLPATIEDQAMEVGEVAALVQQEVEEVQPVLVEAELPAEVEVEVPIPAASQPTQRRTSLQATSSNIPRGPSTKRLSLPTGPTKKHATLPPRKSLSPRHSQSRALTGSLLSQPVTNQFHALKDRNASAVASLATEKAARATEMLRATKRIEALEKSLEGARIECEGWESETVRMAAELEGLTSDTTRTSAMESELERVREEGKGWKEEATREKEKKVRAKALASRLRLELVGRRLKEKWELGVMDREDRERDAIATTLEYEIAIARMQAGLDTILREELEETIGVQARRLSELEASRTILLDSYQAAKVTIDTLRTDALNARKISGELKRELPLAQAAHKAAEVELAEERERVSELEEQVEKLKKVAKGEGRNESKDVADAKAAREKEKSKRDKAEAEVKELKASLKEAQMDVREANKSTALALKAAEAAKKSTKAPKVVAPLPSVATLAARKRRSLTHDGSDPVAQSVPLDIVMELAAPDAEDDSEEEGAREEPSDEEDDTSIEVVRTAAVVKASKPKATKPKVVKAPAVVSPPSPAYEQPEGETSEESYKPLKSKSRAVPAEKVRKAANVDKEKPAKKRKVSVAGAVEVTKKVLGEKSTNGKKAKPVEVEADEEADEEPGKKKKKRLLFGGKSKFNWGSIENADVNSLGIPTALSPIKGATAGGLTSFGGRGLGLGGGRKSIFSN